MSTPCRCGAVTIGQWRVWTADGMLSGDEVLPTDAPWPLRASLADWSRMALAWVEGL